MALYIAVCNDSVSYRKQLERLLERENDIRVKNSDVLYIDSYGNEKALFVSPMKYDLFILDVRSGDNENLEIVKKLHALGIFCPIACLTEVNYLIYHMGIERHIKDAIPLTEPIFMKKSLNRDHLAALLDYALELKSSRIPTIELRTETDTHYVPVPEIIFAEPDAHMMNVYLTNNRVVSIVADMEKFSLMVSGLPEFAPVGKSHIVNLSHIKAIRNRRVILTDDHVIPVPLLKQSSLQERYQAFQNPSQL